MQTLYHRATEQPGHITNNPPPETLLGYTLPRALQIRPQISFGEIQEILISFHDIQTKPPHHSGLFMLGAICNRWKVVALTQGLSLTVQTPYHWPTEPPGHITNNPPPETLPGYNIIYGYNFSTKHAQTTL